MATVAPGEIVEIGIADGRCEPRDSGDWFSRRVPAIPPRTGLLRLTGISPGDVLEVDLLAVEPLAPVPVGRLIVTISVPAAGTRGGPGAIQAAASIGGVIRLPVQRWGGLFSLGPVLAERAEEPDRGWNPIAARVTVTCTIARRPSD